jgi:hypothetical protein
MLVMEPRSATAITSVTTAAPRARARSTVAPMSGVCRNTSHTLGFDVSFGISPATGSSPRRNIR